MKASKVVFLVFLSLLSLCIVSVQPVKSQFLGSVYINPDGSVTGTNNIQRNGNLYTLTGNISGGIQVQKSYVVVDGAGYAVEGSGEEVGIDLSANYSYQSPIQINNVTVKNLRIVNCYHGIGNENTNNNTFIGNYVADCDTGFWIIGSHNNTLRFNTVKDCVTGISINYGSSGNVITENNIMNVGVLVWLSPEPMVDRNYWSDYLTRYPNAKEIGNSGIWDTPYNYGGSLGNFTDNHPLIKPIVISSNGNPEVPDEQDTTIPTEEHFPTTFVAAACGASVAIIGIGLFLYFKKRGRSRNP